MDPILEVKGLYKVFGEDTDRAFSMINEGADKDKIFEETGLTIGVNVFLLVFKKARFS